MALTTVDQGLLGPYAQYTGFKNRIINGAMMIDQRNAGASVTPTNGQFSADRWKCFLSQASKYSAQQSTTAPAGYINSLAFTSASAYTVGTSDFFMFAQNIEGLNVADLGWGTASAQAVTLSFWVRSSLTGTFGGSVGNNASNRSYPFSYTISSANTWEQKSVTIAGDTTGTWLTTNGTGISLYFSLGTGTTYSGTAGSWSGSNYYSAAGATSVVGTSGATFYITGVQLEKGSTATSFDYRPYGTELALCQRYYSYLGTPFTATEVGIATGLVVSASNGLAVIKYPATMRAVPTVGVVGTVYYRHSGGSNGFTALANLWAGVDSAETSSTISSGSAGSAGILRTEAVTGAITMSAEL